MADTNIGEIIYFYGRCYIVVFWLANCKFSIRFTFTFTVGKISKNYLAEEAKLKMLSSQ